jgi:type IV secretory pathway VirB10-like protein
MPAAKPNVLRSEVAVDKDIHPDLFAALRARTKFARAEYLRALAAEGLAARNSKAQFQATGQNRRVRDVHDELQPLPSPGAPEVDPAPPAPAAAPTPAPARANSSPAPVAHSANSQPAAGAFPPPANKNPASRLPMATLAGR